MDTISVRAIDHLSPAPPPAAPLSFVFADAVPSGKTSLVNGINAVAGVRMEERSPGSYRINIRGSSLRSPFGVRNIRVYWDAIPVTDPGGNTYFNQFAWNNFSSIEIEKGPSAYGAGTGGFILLNTTETKWFPGISAEYITGSYGLQNVFLTARTGKPAYAYANGIKTVISYAHNQSNGYRDQTKMRRDNFSIVSKVKMQKQDLQFSFLFTDLYYQTPGALTLSEYTNNPKAARPAGGGFPGAVAAKAAIYQRNILAGITDRIAITAWLKNTTSIYSSFTQVKNPAIRNYENRMEPSVGGRSVFAAKKSFHHTIWELDAGTEFQYGDFNTRVSKNKNGNPDTLLTDDDIRNRVIAFFSQASLSIDNKWRFGAGATINESKISITRVNLYPVLTQERTYRNEIAPYFSATRSFNFYDYGKLTVQLLAAKGFSPPTTAEVLPSTGVISTDLEAEKGWNFESRVTAWLLERALVLQLTGFSFHLTDALVQRRDLSGADYFVNAGDIRQRGLEFQGVYLKNHPGKLIEQWRLESAITLNNFRYGNFIKGTDDFSGKKLPSVPSGVIAALADIAFKKGIYINANYYYATSIFLNDANTAIADPYHLAGIKIGWKKKVTGPYRLNIYFGIDNLLNEKYSLGNDINAAANRFYNAAPARNYYAGIAFQWLDTKK